MKCQTISLYISWSPTWRKVRFYVTIATVGEYIKVYHVIVWTITWYFISVDILNIIKVECYLLFLFLSSCPCNDHHLPTLFDFFSLVFPQFLLLILHLPKLLISVNLTCFSKLRNYVPPSCLHVSLSWVLHPVTKYRRTLKILFSNKTKKQYH